MMSTPRKLNLPVVAILGETGTGKSKLAIELAKRFDGEIISADSMQVYKGLDIVTNKVTTEEQQEAFHHFISCTDPLKRYTVVDFQNNALPLIHNLLENKKLPIIVGGTNYYIESLLWNVLLKPEVTLDNMLLLEAEKKQTVQRSNTNTGEQNHKIFSLSNGSASNSDISIEDFEKFGCTLKDLFKVQITQDSFKNIPSNILHKLLSEVDPAKAISLHPNDKRKIVRSLQVYQKSQCRHSDLISEQQSQNGGSSLGGPLRFKNSIMLWLQCDKSVLEKRLDERVDVMVKNGLINELLNFHKVYNKNRLMENKEPNYTEGIFQSIGFKEFHQYLMLSEENQASEEGQKLLKRGIEDMKLHTRKYAKKQNRWIRSRFLRTPDRDLPPIYGLNATDLERWEKNVTEIASHIIECKLQGKVCEIPPLPIEEGFEDLPVTNYCEVCNRVFVGSRTWQIHLNSNRHHLRKISLKRKADALANG